MFQLCLIDNNFRIIELVFLKHEHAMIKQFQHYQISFLLLTTTHLFPSSATFAGPLGAAPPFGPDEAGTSIISQHIIG